MEATVMIPCPSCDLANRMPVERRGDNARCGRCHAPLFPGQPLALDAKRFGRHAGARDLPLVVDFWAPWCGPCRKMAPCFEAAAAALEPRVRLARVDTDAEPELAAQYGIRAVPTLVMFRGGREIARQSGAMPAGALRAWIDENAPA